MWYVLIFVSLVSSTYAIYIQQGSKLVGTGGVGAQIDQGNSVSLSSDGNTLASGGPFDNSGTGAVWVFTRSNGNWSQQGSKLVGTGGVGTNGQQGTSVSLSSDGNTLASGGWYDNAEQGAVWVFTRSDGIWSQQGSKLVGTSPVGTVVLQGHSVSLSSDGNTLAEGGDDDNSNQGAVWVFTRSSGTWSQQGSKLVGTSGSVSEQGQSVSLSSDGDTLASGGYRDNNWVGAVWVFTRTGGTWSQQGSKLVGSGAIGTAYHGYSVSLSADGSTLTEGGYGDNSFQGAIWVFTRSNGTWSQRGLKLNGTADQSHLSLSSDGNTLALGGPGDNSSVGAVWMYQWTPPTSSPSCSPTAPSRSPSTSLPSKTPSSPSRSPTRSPSTFLPSKSPSHSPTQSPTLNVAAGAANKIANTIDAELGGGIGGVFAFVAFSSILGYFYWKRRKMNTTSRLALATDQILHAQNKKYAVFISYHQGGAGSDANVIYDFFLSAGFNKSQIFFDKSNLNDIRELSAAVASSLVLVQLQSAQLYFRPFTLIEAYVAVSNNVKVVPVALDSYNFAAASAFLNEPDFSVALERENPCTVNEIKRADYDPIQVGKVIAREFPNLVSLPFHAHASTGVRHSQLIDILQKLFACIGIDSSLGQQIVRKLHDERRDARPDTPARPDQLSLIHQR